MAKRAVRGAADLYRVLVTVVMLGVLVATMSWLQSRFDTSDHDKATELVRDYTPRGQTKDLTTAILERHPGRKKHDISWRSEILSSCYGHVRVSAYLPAKGGEDAVTYAFDVDLKGPSIHPTDERTIAILKSMSTATSTASKGS